MEPEPTGGIVVIAAFLMPWVLIFSFTLSSSFATKGWARCFSASKAGKLPFSLARSVE